MSESEKVDKNDEEQLGAVLQLTPNKKNTQQAAITKRKEDELVSLDELYEEAGQEAVNKFLEGFRLLVNANKLSKAHGEVLNVKGFENWLELPDSLNAYKGGESFLEAIKNGTVSIVKTMVSFIIGITNWINVRVKSLINYDKAIKDVAFIHKSSDEYKRIAVGYLKGLGVDDFNEKEFLNQLPTNLTTSELLTITKVKLDNNEQSFNRIKEANEYIRDYVKVINTSTINLKEAKNGYEKAISLAKEKIKQTEITVNDIKQINLTLTNTMDNSLNPNNLVSYLDGLLKILYGIEIDGISSKSNFKQLREQVEQISEDTKLTYNDTLFEKVNSLTVDLYKNLYKGANYDNAKLNVDIINNLKKFIDEGNSALIEKLSNSANDKILAATYIDFCNRVTIYPAIIEIILIAIQRVESSIVSIIKWHSYLNDIIIAYVTRSIAQLAEVHEMLPPEVRKKLDSNKLYIDQLPQVENKVVSEETAKRAAAFFKTTKGKELLQYYSSIAT